MIFLTVVLLAILSLGVVSAQEANNSVQLDSSDNFILNDDSTTPVNNDKAVYVETDGDDKALTHLIMQLFIWATEIL